jgi:hypothetical protein
MTHHWRYAKYVARHKAFVLVAGIRLGPPAGFLSWVPWLVRLIVHDWSKLLPSEWIPYADYFYGPPVENCPTCLEKRERSFNRAWLLHQHRSRHHWQSYVLREDSGLVKHLPMPPAVVREMVADWMGAGRAIKGTWDARPWYLSNSLRIILHPETRDVVYQLLGVAVVRGGQLVAAEAPIA